MDSCPLLAPASPEQKYFVLEGFRLYNEVGVEIHKNIVHLKKEPFICEYCDLAFLIHSNLESHQRPGECRFQNKAANIPALSLPSEEEENTFDNNNGLIVNPLSEYSEQNTEGQVWYSDPNLKTTWIALGIFIYFATELLKFKWLKYLCIFLAVFLI